jgi:hypothetical protein
MQFKLLAELILIVRKALPVLFHVHDFTLFLTQENFLVDEVNDRLGVGV